MFYFKKWKRFFKKPWNVGLGWAEFGALGKLNGVIVGLITLLIEYVEKILLNNFILIPKVGEFFSFFFFHLNLKINLKK